MKQKIPSAIYSKEFREQAGFIFSLGVLSPEYFLSVSDSHMILKISKKWLVRGHVRSSQKASNSVTIIKIVTKNF